MKLLAFFLRLFFDLLYHQFAWTYDLVAALVSLGRWQDWVRAATPYLEGRVLEIGYGPGHLQAWLAEKGNVAFGVDESRQMARQAHRRLAKNGYPSRLCRGRAENLPYAQATFDSAAATFPSEYIFDRRTLSEIKRVLRPGGKLIILPMAWITGSSLLERLMAWVYRITGEAPGKPQGLRPALQEQFRLAGFLARSEIVTLKNSQVLVIIARSLPE